MAFDFSGKKALVTGGGRGIGKEIVKRLVKCKAEVIALDIDQENLNILKNEIPSVHTVCVDLSDWKTTRKVVEGLGVIDMLANNAGIIRRGNFEKITEEDLDKLYAVNVKPIVNISQVIVKALKACGKPGSIVNTSSASATVSVPSVMAYSAGKAAVDKLTETMAVELAEFGIRVNAVKPTRVRTKMTEDILQGEYAEKMLNLISLRKFAETGDIAAAVVFLLSEEAKMITGTCLHVDGGRTCSKP